MRIWRGALSEEMSQITISSRILLRRAKESRWGIAVGILKRLRALSRCSIFLAVARACVRMHTHVAGPVSMSLLLRILY